MKFHPWCQFCIQMLLMFKTYRSHMGKYHMIGMEIATNLCGLDFCQTLHRFDALMSNDIFQVRFYPLGWYYPIISLYPEAPTAQ